MRTLLLLLLLSSAPGSAGAAEVKTGTDRLFEPQGLALLQGKRVGVLAHRASRTREGGHLVDLLFARTDLKLTAIFAPEHGLRGGDDTALPDSKDPVTGLTIYSLYGPRKAPTPELLDLVDVVVIDLQDVGVRYYTYQATMALTMKACKAAGKKVIVLDRPNPVGGLAVEGAVLEPVFQGGDIAYYYPLISRHGMTMGELALLYNVEYGIDADLTVVPMSGWERSMYWEDTGLSWWPPSPALEAPDQTVAYALLGSIEWFNLAVGRGQTNENAFRRYGAPWISETEARGLVQRLKGENLPGLSFDYVEWTPTRSTYEGKLCRGFSLQISDRASLRGFESQLRVMRALWETFGARLKMQPSDPLIGARWVREQTESGASIQSMLERADRESELFRRQRARHLLY
jgi:uncharacterized protein YbbC (DUF1343 family)